MLVGYHSDGSYTIYPKCSKSYCWDCEEKERFVKKILRQVKRKKLPKDLEVSLAEEVLKILEESPEHKYKGKYDVF